MTSRLLILAPALALAACTFDADGDGISNSDERDLGLNPDLSDSDADGMSDADEIAAGTDPLVADTDGDGLVDGDEIANGADPLIVDTDDDGYTDRDEVYEGHDPADPKDRIYKGRWPYVFDKSVINKGPKDFREVGKTFLRLKMVDQHGEEVDLYDFYNADKPVVIDISAQWCPPCMGLAGWFAGMNSNYDFWFPGGPEALKQEKFYWITVLAENDENPAQPADATTVAEWDEDYPNKKVPVLADDNYLSADYVGLTWFPTVFLLEPDLKVSADTPTGYAEETLEVLCTRFAEPGTVCPDEF
jgi:thiol-disulfide isomerase/thioredoxin